jgi:hypothetical protein
MDNTKIIVKQATAMQKMVDETIVTNDKEYQALADKVKNVKTLKKAIEKQKDEYVAPAKVIIAKARVDYDPYIKQCESAETQLKQKGVVYYLAEEKKKKEAEEKLAARVEKGTMKEETAVRKMEELKPVEKTVKTESGASLGMVETYVPRIIDEKAIERDYLMVDVPKVNKESIRRHKEGLEPLAGVIMERRLTPSSR